MDVNKLRIHYACFYCKKDCYTLKSSLTEHWEKGCKRMQECFSTRLILKTGSTLQFVTVFLNPKNVDIDLAEIIFKHIEWPTTNIHFTTHSRWKKAKQESCLYESSDGED